MKRDSAIKIKSMNFAIRIIKLRRFLQNAKEFDLSSQVARSGTAIGALIREAEYAESKADFVHKMRIALKEANETSYWLELLYKTEILDNNIYNSVKADNEELKKMLVCIINTSIKSL
ncbi:four helix bundle protein [uncultured Parabacteroides sp.]|uniref:four helix bundle protein n=1 Tax=uncultured Parabacteroides sp. TaxID=512312 RepID=UPI00261D3CAB|nr:four helix bundle protein [uncultured Parabacteroides sp.]